MKARERSFDEGPKGGEFVKVRRYKAVAGRQDLIMILKQPRWTPRHFTGAFYLHCIAEDGKAGPCCKEFGKASPCNTTYVLHVARREKSGDWSPVGEALVWGFGEDKWAQFQAILRDHFDGDFARLQKAMISVTCQDSVKQKLFMSVYPKGDVKLTKAMVDTAKANQDMFEAAIDVDEADVLQTLKRLGSEQAEAEVEADANEDAEPAAQAADAASPSTSMDDLIAGLDEDGATGKVRKGPVERAVEEVGSEIPF